MTAQLTEATEELRAARDFLFGHRDDYDEAVASFQWPRPGRFNWALEWFDVIATERPAQPALVIVEEVFGTLFVAILIARLAGIYPPKPPGEVR